MMGTSCVPPAAPLKPSGAAGHTRSHGQTPLVFMFWGWEALSCLCRDVGGRLLVPGEQLACCPQQSPSPRCALARSVTHPPARGPVANRAWGHPGWISSGFGFPRGGEPVVMKPAVMSRLPECGWGLDGGQGDTRCSRLCHDAQRSCASQIHRSAWFSLLSSLLDLLSLMEKGL